MLFLTDADTIEGLTIYGDDQDFSSFYYIPNVPTYRRDQQGRPMFRFIKYRLPIDRPDGRVGGGFVSLGVELSVAEERLATIRSQLQRRVDAEAEVRGIAEPPQVKLSSPTFVSGTVSLNLSNENSILIERVHASRVPALYGTNAATFFIELTPEGATILEQSLQELGGFVTVQYELNHLARLPPISATATFEARAYYQFIQEINVEERWAEEDDYTETLSEYFEASEARKIELDPGGVTDKDVINQVRQYVTKALDEAVERTMLEAIPPEDAEEAKQLYKENDIENVSRTVNRWRINDVRIDYLERSTIEVPANPSDSLPTITSLVDNEGNPIRWEDYSQSVDADDPFFRQVRVNVGANADFSALPIHSIEVKLNYRGRPMAILGDGPGVDGEYRFTADDGAIEFASFVEEDDYRYTYSYQVNYVGESQIYQSEEITTDESVLTVGVDDTGVLTVDMAPGDINWTQISQVQIVLRYEDEASGVGPIERPFVLTEQSPNARFQEIIFVPRQAPYQYRLKYIMTDGKEYQLGWTEHHGDQLLVNDPFSATKRIGVRAAGDLDQDISVIYVDLAYRDEVNDYRQEVSVALSARKPFYDWEFPVIDDSVGSVTYSGTIVNVGGATTLIPATVTTSATPLVGDLVADRLSILILADLIDFRDVRLIRVALRYEDLANDLIERMDVVFGGSRPKDATWNVDLADRSAIEYEYSAQYFMADGSRRELGPIRTTDLTLPLELPAG